MITSSEVFRSKLVNQTVTHQPGYSNTRRCCSFWGDDGSKWTCRVMLFKNFDVDIVCRVSLLNQWRRLVAYHF